MIRDLVTVSPINDLSVAFEIFEKHQFRHLPVVGRDGSIRGIIARRELLGLQAVTPNFEGRRTIAMVMIRNVVTITPRTLLKEAAQIMLTKKIGCLPVVQNHKLCGIITEADFVKAYLRAHEEFELEVH